MLVAVGTPVAIPVRGGIVRTAAASFTWSGADSGKAYCQSSMTAWCVGPSCTGVSLCSVQIDL